jgi:hypothetical protein
MPAAIQFVFLYIIITIRQQAIHVCFTNHEAPLPQTTTILLGHHTNMLLGLMPVTY